MSDSKQYRVVTQYTEHPRMGDWESTVRRPMTMDEACTFMANKMAHIVKRGETPSLGKFKGMLIETLHEGYEWDGRLSCCQRGTCRGPSELEALASVISKALGDVTGLALAETLISAGYGKV